MEGRAVKGQVRVVGVVSERAAVCGCCFFPWVALLRPRRSCHGQVPVNLDQFASSPFCL